MGRTHLVMSDRHCAPGLDLSYHSAIGQLILDLKPDVVIDNGDGADMPSLCAYDKGSRRFQGRSYGADISAAIEGNDRMWSPIRRAKRKMPRRITTIGNHEYRITRALDLSPELDGAISLRDLQLEDYYNEVINYEGNTPGVIEVDGVYYAHYLVSGIKGLPISGEHPAAYLVARQGASCTVGHSHLRDFSHRSGVDGRTRLGLVTGTCSLVRPHFAGRSALLWWQGLVICRNVEDGYYDPEFVSLQRLMEVYSDH